MLCQLLTSDLKLFSWNLVRARFCFSQCERLSWLPLQECGSRLRGIGFWIRAKFLKSAGLSNWGHAMVNCKYWRETSALPRGLFQCCGQCGDASKCSSSANARAARFFFFRCTSSTPNYSLLEITIQTEMAKTGFQVGIIKTKCISTLQCVWCSPHLACLVCIYTVIHFKVWAMNAARFLQSYRGPLE